MSHATAELPESIAKLDELFFENIALEDELERQVTGLNARLEAATGSSYERCGVKVSSDGYHGIIRAYQERVEKIAQKELSVPGGPFEPDTELRPCSHDLLPYSADAERREGALKKLSPSSYWRVVAATVDPKAQQETAARQAAIDLGRFVGLLAGDRWGQRLSRNEHFVPPKVVRGCIELELVGVYVQDGYGRRRLAVSDSALQTAQAIQYALDATGFEGQPVGDLLHRTLLHISAYDYDFTPRERVDVGGGASIVTFVKGSKLYLPQEVAGSINLFVSEQLADELATSAETA